jgi:ubiquinone/menaquinone biosynthesis C-methylase UbiE
MKKQVFFIFYFFVITLIISCKPYKFISSEGKELNPMGVKEYFKEEVAEIALNDGDTLVDIGFGNAEVTGLYASIKNNVKFILIDINKLCLNKPTIKNKIYAIERIYKNYNKFNIKTVLNTQTSIPLPNESYPTILCRMSYHEFDNKPALLQEIKRILKPNGRLIIIETKPLIENEIDKGCKKPHYTSTQIKDTVLPLGFSLISSNELKQAYLENNILNILTFEKN